LAEASVALNDAIKSRALALEQAGVKALDALHLACAEAAGAERFLTCDDRLIRRYSGQMMVQSPVTFTTDLTENMSVTVQNESATTAEAVEVLMERMPASKVARLLSSWQIGQGDYLKLREELFGNETVESLYQAASANGQKK